MPEKPKKNRRGSVQINAIHGRLRLVWRHKDQRYYLYCGLPDSQMGRIIATQRAAIIEADLLSNNFDSSIRKYKTDEQVEKSLIKVTTLWQKFSDERIKSLHTSTQKKYSAIANLLAQFFGDQHAESIDSAKAEEFFDWLRLRNAGRAVKEKLFMLSACWEFGVEGKILNSNPWQKLIARVKPEPKAMPEPFSLDEVNKIIQGFQDSENFSYLADFVIFLFSTGVRLGEAIALRWEHVSPQCSVVQVCESIARDRERKGTKTGKSRTIKVSRSVQEMLKARRPEDPDPFCPVFPAKQGGVIDDDNFGRRAWKTVLMAVGVSYKNPYQTRHTFVSHALQTMHPTVVAGLTGHDVRTLYKNYAGCIASTPSIPELYGNPEN